MSQKAEIGLSTFYANSMLNDQAPNDSLAKSKMLLHVCCAPCSPHVVATLSNTYNLTLYFYNPNIHPKQEYEHRLSEVTSWAISLGIPLIADEYDSDKWFSAVAGLEDEPERGERCAVCFDIRLKAAAAMASKLGITEFGTVLTVSPHKDAALINRIGKSAAEGSDIVFYEADWKKKEGYKITTKLAREAGFYRQNYCGCTFSQRERR